MSQAGLPLAGISLDLDDLWTYLRTHGDAAWESRPSFLARFVPAVLDELDEAGITLTFFIVGADAAQTKHHPLFREIVSRGHEIGNHSFEHEPWLHLYSRERLVAEVQRTEDALAQATGQRPVGFRGPGYSWSADLLEILADRQYLYDASTLPTYLGPLARAYYFWSGKLTAAERSQRKALFGTLRDGTRPTRPYQWQLSGNRMLLELPVTTIPLVKLPFHLSYLHYLGGVSEALAMAYLKSALAACRVSRTPTSLILHPLDLLSGDEVPQLAFFPGMGHPSARKHRLFRRVLAEYGRWFRLAPMKVAARALLAESSLSVRKPRALESAPQTLEQKP